MMAGADRKQSQNVRVELLAPAGHVEALEAVIAAGADAIYLSTKQFNMRAHRSDRHFTLEQLADAVAAAHRADRRLYVTVNALLTEAELPAVRTLLKQLAEMAVDAVIVQDLAVIHLARDVAPCLTLHASTMLNVHHAEQALFLKNLGVRRIIASRDITLHQIGAIGRQAGVEVECFVHGDMCVAQSGQCTMSGVLFGKSANRGACMKPCRWQYELIRRSPHRPGDDHSGNGDDYETVAAEEAAQAPLARGHLLAIKDLCLIRHLPELIAQGICSLKLEGRMRDADYLHALVSTYRRALDNQDSFPLGDAESSALYEQLHRRRIRDLSTLTLLDGTPHRDRFDTSGRREPLFLSDGMREATLREHLTAIHDEPPGNPQLAGHMRLAVTVADIQGGEAALEAGADRIDLATEYSTLHATGWTPDEIERLIELAHDDHVLVGLHTPRITMDREWMQMQWLLDRYASEIDVVLVHHPGTLRLARKLAPRAQLIADQGFNLLNSAAASVLIEAGVSAATVSAEAGLSDIRALASASPTPLELMVHGPVLAMLVDHCVIALHASPAGRKDLCRGPCRHAKFALRDRTGQERPVMTDPYCRNHLLTGHDLAALPVLEKLLLPNVVTFRIAGQFDFPSQIRAATHAYRARLNCLAVGDLTAGGWQTAWHALQDGAERPFNLGAYPQSLTHARSTAEVMRTHGRDGVPQAAPPIRADHGLRPATSARASSERGVQK